jgi:uncharacterized protein (TIGR00297 family)
VTQTKLIWQSKLILLLVLPALGADIVLQGGIWTTLRPLAAASTLAISALLGLAVWKLRAATPAAALAGAAITASLIFSTVSTSPFTLLHTALTPILVLFLLTFAATSIGRRGTQRLGTAENRRGRSAAQVTANLGLAALLAEPVLHNIFFSSVWFNSWPHGFLFLYAPTLAALAEAAADTVSSEVGQVLGGRPRMITTLHTVEPGTDGAISLAGTLAGVTTAGIVAAAGAWAMGGGAAIGWIGAAGGLFGLFFDSLLGATVERRGWLNNDAVNFLSTASAAAFALVLLRCALFPR